MAKGSRDGVDGLLEMRRNAKEQPADARLGTEQAQARRTIGKLEVVDAHDLHTLRVDDLLVKQVAREQHLIRLQIRKADIRCRHVQAHAGTVIGLDVLTPRNHKRGLTRTDEGQRGNTRKDLARGDGQVTDNADLFAVFVEDGLLENLTQVDHAGGLLYSYLCATR